MIAVVAWVLLGVVAALVVDGIALELGVRRERRRARRAYYSL